MDGDLSARLEQVLSDPAQMEKIAQMAQSLFAPSGAGPEGGGTPEGTPPARETSGEDARFLSAIGRAFAGGGEKSRSTALLLAMRPYMKPEKQEKLDRALQIARMAHIAGTVMKEYGDGHGL